MGRGKFVWVTGLLLIVGMAWPYFDARGEEVPGFTRIERFHPLAAQMPSADIVATLDQLEREETRNKSRGKSDVALFEKLADGVVLLKTEQGLGSGGVIYCEEDYCLAVTNWHVVGDRKKVQVYFRPRRASEEDGNQAGLGLVMARDATRDLAMVAFQLPPKRTLPVFPLADLARIQIGEDVSAIGHPLGLMWSYAKGIVTNISRQEWGGAKDDPKHRAMLIQTQTPISSGNSGGPLINEQGQLIGVNTMSIEKEGVQNLNFAIAVNEVKDLFAEMLKVIEQQQKEAEMPSPPPAANDKPNNCTENYSQDPAVVIVGCLVRVVAPPPDTWIVGQGDQLFYTAVGYLDSRRLDAIVFPAPNSGMRMYMDADCDGRGDLVREQDAKGRYTDTRVTKARALTLTSLAPQLDSAIQKGQIPFKVSFCK